ncbi:hypothetical protein [Enterococcus sp. CWB-B31]|uniref:hypothetical protein n=1 Tax=Enterococcus sp. CWB-B31 TaxID=2885159 RepID=UPI001E4D7A22|nr:hypothetical protein [Enterococcus sp. CWB-B31]MCB5954828.1 hypothetical protein [Enterococcus sp. CWB-B31]
MDKFEKMLVDLDYLTEKGSKIEPEYYQDIIESYQVSASGEQGVYYAMVSKKGD